MSPASRFELYFPRPGSFTDFEGGGAWKDPKLNRFGIGSSFDTVWTEKAYGGELLTARKKNGPMFEIFVGPREVKIGLGAYTAATYSRISGRLKDLWMSVPMAILQVVEGGVFYRGEALERAANILKAQRDLQIKLNLQNPVQEIEFWDVDRISQRSLVQTASLRQGGYSGAQTAGGVVDYVPDKGSRLDLMLNSWDGVCDLIGAGVGVGVRASLVEFLFKADQGNAAALIPTKRHIDFSILNNRDLDLDVARSIVSASTIGLQI